MSINWDALVAAFLAACLVTTLQNWHIRRSLNRVIEFDIADGTEKFGKKTRQDVAGIMILLSITNTLLAAILGAFVIS